MRTTVRLDPSLMQQVKRVALQRNTTMTRVIEDALRQAVAPSSKAPRRKRFRLITFGSGGLQPGVNLDDSAGLRDIMDGH